MYFSASTVLKQLRSLYVSDITISSSRGFAQNVTILLQSSLKALRAVINRIQKLGGLELDIQIKLPPGI